MSATESNDIEAGKQSLVRRRVKVTITKDHLEAVISLSRPKDGEPPLDEQEVYQVLEEAGVKFGIDNDKVVSVVSMQQYDEPLVIAKGKPMVQGKHTEFEYLFQTENRFQPQEGEDGRIDYRDMGYIQNVTKDSVLVRRTLPQEGTTGTGVDGEEIEAPRGRNIPFSFGENVKVSEDELELTSACDGAIVYARGKVSVKDVMQIKDVDFNVGNIDCVGSVRINGNINTGFEVKVGGDLEVNGFIDDAQVICGGNILVRGGLLGGGGGSLKAGGDITIKFGQGQSVTSDATVIVGGELINCTVIARDKVVVNGRNGKIVGGETSAGKSIEAHDIGSDAGTITVITVAYDENLMKKYHTAKQEIERLQSDLDRVKERLYLLYKLQMDNKLTPQHEQVLTQLVQFEKSVPEALKVQEETIADVEKKLAKMRDARLIAKGTIYPGVRVNIGHLVKEIDEELTNCELSQDGISIQVNKL